MSQSLKEMEASTICTECAENQTVGLTTTDGRGICQPCADLYYVACGVCLYWTPREESVIVADQQRCSACKVTGENQLSEDDIQTLISSFIQLHAEEKKIKDRLEEIKERLKQHAAFQPRISNAVVLRSSDGAVKVGYSTRLSYDAEQLVRVETMLGENLFARLFEREVKFNPMKEKLEEFLTSENPEEEDARNAIRGAQQVKEIATIAPTVARTSLRKSAKE